MTPQKTTNSSLYVRDPAVVARRVGEEMVLVPVRRQVSGPESIYTLNTVGTVIWEQLAAPVTPDTLVEAILSEFEITPAQAATDVCLFLASLQELSLVSVTIP